MIGDHGNSMANNADSRGDHKVTRQPPPPTPPLNSNQKHHSSEPSTTSTARSRASLSNTFSSSAHSRSSPPTATVSWRFPTAQPVLPAMEAMPYGSMQNESQDQYMALGYYGMGSQVTAGNPTNLSILNSDTYNVERTAPRPALNSNHEREFALPFTVNNDNVSKTESDEPERAPKGKRKRPTETQVDDEEEARKKARGRPRVEPKDETAADRRRTQIRMAQRAYRNRKETTITTLEKQVQDLRGTNEEMSNIFISLYDFAVGKGLLQREPEFGQQLQSTTQRFLALVKASTQNEGSNDDPVKEPSEEPVQEPPKKTKPARTTKKSQRNAEAPKTDDQSVVPWGGYTVTTDDSSAAIDSTPDLPLDYHQQNFHYPRQEEIQIITRPTEDNASFPFEPFDMMNLQNYRVEIPNIEDYSHNFFPQSQPPLPTTVSHHEHSFARRMHRHVMERAYRLVTLPNPPPNRFEEVFKLSLMYESKEDIIKRIRKIAYKSSHDCLHEWQQPFVHTGGSGTFYPAHDAGELRPRFRTGYSMGPFSPQVSDVQELMDDDMRCTLPGFEGEFFDVNDVEGYLRGRGLEIPATADFITAELDLSEFTGPKSAGSGETAADISPATPGSPINQMLIPGNLNESFNYSSTDLKNFSFPMDLFPQWNLNAQTDPSLSKVMEIPNPEQSTPPVMSEPLKPQRQWVRVNVNVLIHEIGNRGVCLGRSPGFRPKDINAALLTAINTDI